MIFDPALILQAYAQGLFPMADYRDAEEIHWYQPDKRGQLSITEMHIPRRLLKTVKNNPYDIRINTAFRDVMTACAESAPGRENTWINHQIIEAFCVLHAGGHAHSIEVWDEDCLVGGLYGLALGGVFCGESMFSRVRDASKIALVHLVARLWTGGFSVLDTQFVNDHLKQFGVYEVDHEGYMGALLQVLEVEADFVQDGRAEADILRAYLKFRPFA